MGMDVPVQFGDSRSNGFRDIRGADFVSNERTIERTNIAEAHPNSVKRYCVSPKNLVALKLLAVVVSCHLVFYCSVGP